jgi:hypothetical protein
VGDLAREARAGGPLKNQLISVLRDAGTPEAQAALRDLLQEPSLAAGDRLQIVRGLSRVDEPTSETVATLTKLVDDESLGEQAQYGLGGNVYRLQRTNPDLAQQALSVLEQRLQNAKTDQERVVLLQALGNAGAPSSLPLIERHLSFSSEAVQVAATQALQRIPGATVDLLLVKQLRQAASQRVRVQAAETVRYREPVPVLVAALGESLSQEAVKDVRRAVMDVAAHHLSRSSALQLALTTSAASDPDPELRAHAQKLLGKS